MLSTPNPNYIYDPNITHNVNSVRERHVLSFRNFTGWWRVLTVFYIIIFLMYVYITLYFVLYYIIFHKINS